MPSWRAATTWEVRWKDLSRQPCEVPRSLAGTIASSTGAFMLEWLEVGSAIPESRNPGIPESRNPGIPESRNPGIPIRHFFCPPPPFQCGCERLLAA